MNDDFISWKHHPITVVVMAEFQRRIGEFTEEMIDQAQHTSQLQLAWRAGAIRAYRDVLNIHLDLPEGDSDGD